MFFEQIPRLHFNMTKSLQIIIDFKRYLQKENLLRRKEEEKEFTGEMPDQPARKGNKKKEPDPKQGNKITDGKK